MGCCPEPTNRRYNENGELEVSYDNGGTWTVDPALDDRFSGVVAPDLPGEDGSEKACIGATAGQEYVKQNLIDSLQVGATFADLNAVAVALAAVLGVTGVGILIAAFAAAVFVAGVSAVQAAFTSGVWADLKCILYCNIEPDASYTEEGWQGVKADILSTYTGIVSAVLYNWVNSVGAVGLTNAARSGFAVDGDCGDCACENCSNLDAWSVVFGTIIEQTPGYIKLASVDNGFGQQSCRMVTGDMDICCYVTVGDTTGAGWTSGAYYPCGSASPTGFPSPPENMCTHDINAVNIFGSAFTVEFLFADCP